MLVPKSVRQTLLSRTTSAAAVIAFRVTGTGTGTGTGAVMVWVYCFMCAYTVNLSFQFSKPPPSSNALLFGSIARFDLSAMDVPALIDERLCGASRAVRRFLLSGCTADFSRGRRSL
jgi:hypothetical protein